jgi:hypothetical protein
VKKLVLSLGTLVFTSALLAGSTGAYLNSQAKSQGNKFVSGIINVKIDNESYVTNTEGDLAFSPNTSWELSDLAGKLFYDFPDVKPGDMGEDTVSVHVQTNDAWVCMQSTLTGTPENGITEPESEIDDTLGDNDGEMQYETYFVFWSDDGDNVYEKNEYIFKRGLAKDVFDGQVWSLSDSKTNIWGKTPKPLAAGTTKYFAKAWCYGVMSELPIAQDGLGKTGTNGPLDRGSGFACNGEPLGNILQSDGLVVDVNFTAVQSRNNDKFVCGKYQPPHQPKRHTLVYEDFEGKPKHNKHVFGAWSWSAQGNTQITDGRDGQVAELCASDRLPKFGQAAVLATKSFDASLYQDLVLTYDYLIERPGRGGAQPRLQVEYSLDNGKSWQLLETAPDTDSWKTQTVSLPETADFIPHVIVRFVVVGQGRQPRAYIDNISVTGLIP